MTKRRLGVLTEALKLLKAMTSTKTDSLEQATDQRTGGNGEKLRESRTRLKIRMNFISKSEVSTWNKLMGRQIILIVQR